LSGGARRKPRPVCVFVRRDVGDTIPYGEGGVVS